MLGGGGRRGDEGGSVGITLKMVIRIVNKTTTTTNNNNDTNDNNDDNDN